MKKARLLLLLSCLSQFGFAQTNALIKKGNEHYKKGDYSAALSQYQQALKETPQDPIAQYNAGNALLKQGKLAEGRQQLEQAIGNFDNRSAKAKALYNIGNTFLQEKKFSEAIDAYKQALRQQPADADTKYNLSYALQQLKKQEEDKKKQDQNKDKKEDQKDDKKQDQKDKQEEQKDGDQKDKQGQQPSKKEEEKQGEKPQPQPGKLSPQHAENILNALQQEERKVQGRLRQERGMPVPTDKDW